MADDVSAELADLIANSRTFSNSDNIRVGRFLFLIKRVFSDKVDSGRFAFAEMKVVKSEPNPQIVPSGAVNFDDGTKPNMVGSDCALKVNFDGPGAKSAGGNIKEFIEGLFGSGKMTDGDTNTTWRDLSREKSLKKGDPLGVKDNVVIYATEDKGANPACGMLIECVGSMKEKKKTRQIKDLPADKREYITKLSWQCHAKPGTGDNTAELIAKRRAEIEANMSVGEDDEDDDASATPAALAGQNGNGHAAAPSAPAPAAPAAPPPPAVAAAAAAPFVPQAPWVPHPSAPPGVTPETRWFWSDTSKGGDNTVKSEAMLRG